MKPPSKMPAAVRRQNQRYYQDVVKEKRQTDADTKRRYNETMAAYRQHKRDIIQQLKEERGGCANCGYQGLAALDFHHPDPAQKELGVGRQRSGISRIIAEAKKCVLLCCNCHREEHARQRAEALQ